jgi:propanol-preferring alcohol dehydrogenase
MLAMVLEKPGRATASGPLVLRELPDPRPGPGEVRFRVEACGVCRTDLQLAEGELAARAHPIVPGHQIVGVVDALGAGVSTLREGDRVGVGWLGSACGACRFCASGRENLCTSARFTGWDRHGGYATCAVVRADFAVRLPPHVGPLDAAPLLCGGVIGYRSLRRSGVRPGERLGLFGFGASAIVTLQVARHWGCRVFVCTRSEAERARARELGATWAGDFAERPPEPLDAAITFAPVGDAVVHALKALERGGTVAINAIHLDRVPQLDYDDLWLERAIVSVANSTRKDAEELMELAEAVPIRTLIEVHPLDGANEALRRLSEGQVRGAAVLAPGLERKQP